MTEQPTAEKAEEDSEKSFLASFTRADAKLLLITFAGTVAANVVTVMVVAFAVILARSSTTTPRPTEGAVLIDLAAVAAGVMTLGVGVSFMRQRRVGAAYSRVITLIIVVLVVAECLISAVFLLVLLGDAVGVK